MWYVICFMCMFPKASQLFLNVPMMSHKLKRTLIRPLKRVRVYDSSLVCFQYDMLLNAGFFCNLFSTLILNDLHNSTHSDALYAAHTTAAALL